MKLNFVPPATNHALVYCYQCQSHDVAVVGRNEYQCWTCQKTRPRALIIDPAIKWWTDKNKEYWHEVAGVFIANDEGKLLFFERTRYPFGVTVPAGHTDRDENTPVKTAARELTEETGIRLAPDNLTLIASDDVLGDQCRRGSDAHRWHTFSGRVPMDAQIKIDPSEGLKPVWLTLREATQRKLTFVTRRIVDLHGKRILRSVQA
jgi:8-oxo-dGTP pyrophosphatase MutT (NUDIX family)